METQKLSVKAFMKAGGILWGGALLFVGLVNLGYPGYGKAFLEMIGSVYFIHPAAPSLGSVLGLTGIAILDGAVAAGIFALIYNACSHGCCKK